MKKIIINISIHFFYIFIGSLPINIFIALITKSLAVLIIGSFLAFLSVLIYTINDYIDHSIL